MLIYTYNLRNTHKKTTIYTNYNTIHNIILLSFVYFYLYLHFYYN